MITLDTNYLLRFFTRDIPEQASQAKRLIESSKEIYILTIVLAETVYFLINHYLVDKQDVVEKLLSFVKQPNISTANFIPLSFEIYKDENISFYDCLLIAEALKQNMEVKSFDRKFMKIFLKYRQKP